jgi:hypothetical protein
MHPRSQAKIEDPEGIYAKNRGFRKGVADVERMAGKRFKEIVDYVKRYYGTDRNLTDPQVKRAIQTAQMQAVSQAMGIEPRHRELLRDLAVEIAAKERGWLPYAKSMEQAIEDGLVVKEEKQGGIEYQFDFFNVLTFLGEKRIDPNMFQMKPKKLEKLEIPKDFSFDIDDLTPEEERQLEIEKRHAINALIQGEGKRGQFAYQYHVYKSKLDAIDPRLYDLYNKIMSANDLMYFTDEDLIEALGGNAAGAEGKLDGEESDEDGNEKNTYFANGIIFPILVHELVKALGRPQSEEQWVGVDPGMAQDVVDVADSLENEPMQYRVGGELVRKLKTLLPDDLILVPENRVYMPFFEQALYGVPAEDFLKNIIANVVSDDKEDNNKVKRRFEELYKKAKSEYEKYNNDDYEDDEDDILSQLGL